MRGRVRGRLSVHQTTFWNHAISRNYYTEL